VGADFFAVSWEAGFDGGHADTTFLVEYTRAADTRVLSQLCPQSALCNVTGMCQGQSVPRAVLANSTEYEYHACGRRNIDDDILPHL
jgi:hypothetical protein